MSLKFCKYEEKLPDEASAEKKGTARFFEVVTHRFVPFFLAGALTFAALIPGTAIFVWFCMTMPLFSIIGGALAGLLAWPCYTGLYYIIRKAFESFPGFMGPLFRQYLKSNFRKEAPRGLLIGAVISTVIQAGIMMFAGISEMIVFFGFLVFDLILATGIVNGYVHLRTDDETGDTASFKKGFFLFIRNSWKIGSGVMLQLLYWFLVAFFFPYSTFMFVITGIWLPAMTAAFLGNKIDLTSYR